MEVLAKSRDLVIAFDCQGRTTYRNQAASARMAEPDAPAATLFPVAQRPLFEAAARDVLTNGTPARFEWGESTPAGVRTWYSAELTPTETGGICISRDITELKQAEQRLRRSEQLLVDTQGVAHLGTWEWDITQPTATWSAELYRIYGLTPETYTPSYESYLTMVHPDDRQRVIDATNKVFHEHQPYSHDERVYRPDGSIRHLHTWAYPVLDETGKLTRLVGVCQDITDRAQAEEALQRLNSELELRVSERTKQLEAALRDLEAFNTMVTHDLRSPLAAIQMTVNLIARDPDNNTQKTAVHVERISQAIKNMSALMDDLLLFAKVGQVALQPRLIDVSWLCADLVADLRSASPDRQGEIAIQPGIRCTMDPALFRQVLANVIGNAWKYTSREDVARIQIGTVERAAGRTLFVRDNGIGFDMADKLRIFAPFERLKNASDFAGTGIGLAIVQKIIEHHGGNVDVESAPGKGATFFIVLPPAAWS